MVNLQKEIKNNKIFSRWKNLENDWKNILDDVDAILIKDGIEDDDTIKIKTLAIQSWFFKFEFINSIMVLTRDTMIIFGNQEMVKILSFLESEALEHKKKVIFVKKSKKVTKEDVKMFFKEIKKTKVEKFGIFKREQQKGSMIKLFDEEFEKNDNLEQIDISSKIQEFLSVKNELDLNYLRKSSLVSIFFFNELIGLVETVIEKDLHTSHSEISRQMEDILKKQKNNLSKKFDIIPGFYDFSYAPLIQSGTYDLRINAEINDDPLKYDIILLNFAGKYFELNCNIFRTIFINPSKTAQKAYLALHWLHKTIISKFKEGTVLGDIYSESKKEFIKKFPQYEENLPKNFGFGIGYEFRESCLAIREKNLKTVEKGNVFSVITSLKNIKNDNDKIFSLHISDTIVVELNGKTTNLTASVGSDFNTIGYNIDEDKTKTEQYKSTNKHNDTNGTKLSPADRRTRSAMRRENMIREQERAGRISQNQKVLLDKKMEELRERLASGNFIKNSSEAKKIILEKLKTYKTGKIPNLSKDEIHIDKAHSSVLLPINNRLVPFHIACIKNVTKHQESKFMSIRFNFQTPSISTGNLVFPMSSTFGSNPIYIKELTFRSTNMEGIISITKQIKEMQKNFKLNLSLNRSSLSKINKEVLKDKLKTLNDLKMRPTLRGRKTNGSLTAYSNGFKFISNKNEIFTLMLSNIDIALFQPCDENMIIILHFLLKNPIVINKKLTKHIQFFSEVGYTTEDLNDPRKKNRMIGYDDYEEEDLENQAKEHYNKLFLNFVKYVQSHWEGKFKFDSPYPELGFFGSPFYNNVFVMPSAYTLMAIIERPFLVIKLEDIELISIERIDNKIKNFDLVVVFKDYSRPVQTINNIPKTNITAIKEWINNQDIVFFEGGTINLKWDKFLKKIREDPETFINEEGGWYAFVDDSDEEDELSGGGEDSSFEIEEEEDEDDVDLDEEDLYGEEDDDFEEDEYDEDEEDDYSEDEKPKKNKKKNKKRFK